MDGGGRLAAGARHAAVGDEGDLEALVLQHAERGRQAVQFRHPIGARPLKAQHHHHVAVQLAVLEGLKRVFLRLEHGGGGLDDAVLRLDRRDLDHRPAEVALHQPQTPLAVERVRGGPQGGQVQALLHRVAPDQFAVLQPRLLEIGLQPLAHNGRHVGMQIARLDQLAGDEGHPARRLKGVHIGRAVRIDPRQQRRDRRQLVHVGPVDQHPRRPGHGHKVDGVIGRPAGGQQGDDHVDDGLFRHDVGHPAAPLARQLDRPLRRRRRQGVAQAGVGMDEGRRGHVQPGDLHHHLIGVGRAVEGAGAGRVVAGDLALQQFGAVDQPLGVFSPNAGLLGVGDAAGHRPGRGEDDGQMAERQRPHEQARHDLVAHPQHQGGVEGVVCQRHPGRHGDDVAAEQAQLHAGAPLGDAVAHGRRSARDLSRGPRLARRLADDLGEALERLMRRQHVVIGGDDAEVRLGAGHRRQLVGHGLAGEGVGPVGAGQLGPARR